jgi:hypothetical protein
MEDVCNLLFQLMKCGTITLHLFLFSVFRRVKLQLINHSFCQLSRMSLNVTLKTFCCCPNDITILLFEWNASGPSSSSFEHQLNESNPTKHTTGQPHLGQRAQRRARYTLTAPPSGANRLTEPCTMKALCLVTC